MGCVQGTTQLLELVDVATDEAGSLALWCLPEITEAGVVECDGSSTYFLELITTTPAVSRSDAATTAPIAEGAPAASSNPVETDPATAESSPVETSPEATDPAPPSEPPSATDPVAADPHLSTEVTPAAVAADGPCLGSESTGDETERLPRCVCPDATCPNEAEATDTDQGLDPDPATGHAKTVPDASEGSPSGWHTDEVADDEEPDTSGDDCDGKQHRWDCASEPTC